jgi:ribosomal protein L11 methyltransferase
MYAGDRWCEPPDPRAVNIILEPGLAFGTGEHPTTRLCLRALAAMRLNGLRVLDYGTGAAGTCMALLMRAHCHVLRRDSSAARMLTSLTAGSCWLRSPG